MNKPENNSFSKGREKRIKTIYIIIATVYSVSLMWLSFHNYHQYSLQPPKNTSTIPHPVCRYNRGWGWESYCSQITTNQNSWNSDSTLIPKQMLFPLSHILSSELPFPPKRPWILIYSTWRKDAKKSQMLAKGTVAGPILTQWCPQQCLRPG